MDRRRWRKVQSNSRQGVDAPDARGTCLGGGTNIGAPTDGAPAARCSASAPAASAPAAGCSTSVPAVAAPVAGCSASALDVDAPVAECSASAPAADACRPSSSPKGSFPVDPSPSSSRRGKQEMNMDKCVNLLRNRIQKLHPYNVDGIVSYMISCKTPVELRQYLITSDEQMQRLIVEAKSWSLLSRQQISLIPPPQSPSGGIHTPFKHWQPQFYPSGSYHGIQPPLHPIHQVGPLQHHQFHPNNDPHGIQVQNPSTGLFGAFQNPSPGFVGSGEHFLSHNIPGDGPQRYYGNACQSVPGYPPSNSKEQIKPCHFHFSMGSCKKGEKCPFSHGSDSTDMNDMRQVQTIEPLHVLEKEINELLLSVQPPKVPIESLADTYIKRYGKPLKIASSYADGQQHDDNLTCLLTMLCTTRVIERRGQCYIVPVGEAPKYLDDGFKLVMSFPTRKDRDQIYITFQPKSTFTKEDVWKYFSKYGPVSDVQIPLRKKRMFGYVSFMYPGTAKRILAERSPTDPHFICGYQVLVKAWKEKHELEKLAQKDAHSNSCAHKVSGVNVIHEHHTGVDMAESSHVQSHLDEPPVAQDCDDFGLPGTLDDIY